MAIFFYINENLKDWKQIINHAGGVYGLSSETFFTVELLI